MPINYLSRLTDFKRTDRANRHLGRSLAFVAGALNAGGFLAIGQYTSHMTGFVSSLADNVVRGRVLLLVAALLSVFSFVLGAITSACLIAHAKQTNKPNIYSVSLYIEVCLLLLFAVAGSRLQAHQLDAISLTAPLLCYTMGLQNALITKISNAEIRTTHLTGLITDIGIGIGTLVAYRGGSKTNEAVVSQAHKALRIHLSLTLAFVCGAFVGAFGFKYIGFAFTLPLALIVAALAAAPSLRQPSADKVVSLNL